MTASTKTLSTKVVLPIFKVHIRQYQFVESFAGSVQGTGENYFLVEAPNQINAMLQITKEPGYIKNYNRMTPEERKKIKSPKFRLDTEKRIERVPDCEIRHKNKYGQYTCGEVTGEYDDLNGEFGMCAVQGYDVPETEECPFNRDRK